MKLTKYQNNLANFMTDNGIPQDIAVLLASRENNSKVYLNNLPIRWVVGRIFVWVQQPEGVEFWSDFYDAFEEECNVRKITAQFNTSKL